MHARARNYQNVMIQSFASQNLPIAKAWLHHRRIYACMAYFPPDTCMACGSLDMPRFRRVVKEVLWTSALSESTR